MSLQQIIEREQARQDARPSSCPSCLGVTCKPGVCLEADEMFDEYERLKEKARRLASQSLQES